MRGSVEHLRQQSMNRVCLAARYYHRYRSPSHRALFLRLDGRQLAYGLAARLSMRSRARCNS